MNPGSETLALSLRRESANQPWGFRLQGGIDFTTPLSVQSVGNGGVAERCGLLPGDAVLSINDRSADELEHEEAKRCIMMSGNEVNVVIQRGAVKVWKPKVTPMSELRPAELGQVGSQGQGQGEPFVQKTSLAAEQRDVMHIGSAHNRSARPFPGFGGGAPSPAAPPPQQYQPPPQQYQPPPQQQQQPYGQQQQDYGQQQQQHQGYGQQQDYGQQQGPAVVNAQYNTPIDMYSSGNVADTYAQQSQALTGGMANLQVDDAGSEKRSVSPTMLLVMQQEGGSTPSKASPRTTTGSAYLSVDQSDGPTMRSVSPTMLALMEEQKAKDSANQEKAAMYKDWKEGEEIKYQGYSNPHKQSRSFQMLQMGLDGGEQNGSSPVAGAPSYGAPAGGGRVTKSVSAPVAKPPSERKEAQYMRCKVCGSLCVGVFVRIKGEPMHPECFKCTKCSRSLKQQGYITVQDQLYCEPCAKQVAMPPGDNMAPTAVYR